MSEVSPALVQVIVDGAKRFSRNARYWLPIREQRWKTVTANKHGGLWQLQLAHDDLTRALRKVSPSTAPDDIGTALADISHSFEQIRAYYGLDKLSIPISVAAGPPASAWWPSDWPPPEIDSALLERFDAGIRRLDGSLGVSQPTPTAAGTTDGPDEGDSVVLLRDVLARICESDVNPPLALFLELGQVLHDVGMGHYTDEAVEGRHIEAMYAKWLLYAAGRWTDPLIDAETRARVRDDNFLRDKLGEIEKANRWLTVRGEFVKYSTRAIEELESRIRGTQRAARNERQTPSETTGRVGREPRQDLFVAGQPKHALSADCVTQQDSAAPSAYGLVALFSYSHKDEEMRDRLETHLAAMKRQQLVKTWHDRKIGPGKEWERDIRDQLESADIILLLVSADFIASDYCYAVELKHALARHAAGTARVIPIILGPCDWKATPLGKLQALPKDGKPVINTRNRDRVFAEIASALRSVIEEVNNKKAK